MASTDTGENCQEDNLPHFYKEGVCVKCLLTEVYIKRIMYLLKAKGKGSKGMGRDKNGRSYSLKSIDLKN